MAIDFGLWLEQAPNRCVCLDCGAVFMAYLVRGCPSCQSKNHERGWTPWFPVESSNLAAARFKPDGDGSRGVLEIRFRSGAVYRYRGVLAEVFIDLVDPGVALSKGWYFNERVKKVYDDYEKVI